MRDGRSLSRRSNEQLWVMRRLGFNIKEYKWIFTRGQQGTWSNWRSNLVQLQEFIGWGCLWPCAKHEGPVTCVVEVKKKASRGVYCRPASRPGFLKHLRTWGGWPLLSGMEKNHTASKMDRQKMEKKTRIHVFCSVSLPEKKGVQNFFWAFFHFLSDFFHCQGQYFKDNKDGFGIFTWARIPSEHPLFFKHWSSHHLRRMVADTKDIGAKADGIVAHCGEFRVWGFFFPLQTCDWYFVLIKFGHVGFQKTRHLKGTQQKQTMQGSRNSTTRQHQGEGFFYRTQPASPASVPTLLRQTAWSWSFV